MGERTPVFAISNNMQALLQYLYGYASAGVESRIAMNIHAMSCDRCSIRKEPAMRVTSGHAKKDHSYRQIVAQRQFR